MVTRLSIPGATRNGEPRGDPRYGTQLADFALPSLEPEARVHLEYHRVPVVFEGGQQFILHQPELVIRDLSQGPLDEKAVFSNRLAPAVHGMGLINELSDETLLSFADPDDRVGDGISGRPNLVWDRELKKKRLGRFGWKASQPTLKQQIADAFVNDIGITSSLFPSDALGSRQAQDLGAKAIPNGGLPEVSDQILDRVTTYLATIAPPARRGLEEPSVLAGKAIFHRTILRGCRLTLSRA